ncbi:ricin B lectin domain-containing protein, partial [Jimgerdemannia flammicorona]
LTELAIPESKSDHSQQYPFPTPPFKRYFHKKMITPIDSEEFPHGYFYIKSKKNGMVLDVEEASVRPNARVIVWPQKFRDNSNQLWSYDEGFLVNKNSGLGMLQSDRQIVQSKRKFTAEAQNQLWHYCEEGFFYPLEHSNLVLDIRGDSDKPGATILLYQRKDADNKNQLWTIEPYGVSGETFSFSGQEGYSYSFSKSSYDI